MTALVDAGNGIETARYEYGPFGDVLRAEGAMAKANPFRFSTKYQDRESELLYYGHRYYSSTFQRWLNRDPLGEEGGLNLYGFVDNNPINGFDPLGQWAYFQPSTWFDGKGYQPGDVENFNGQLAQSILDGIIPFADPFGDNGGYDKCDNLLAIGRHLGEFSRNAYLMRVNMGLGEWAAAGTGLGRSAVGLAANGVNLGLSAQAIGTGAGKLSAGDAWGAVDLGLGLLGVKPSISGVMRDGSRLVSGARGAAVGAANGFDALGRMARNGKRPLQAQCANNTCGPNSAAMILDTLNPARASSGVVNLELTKAGTKITKLEEMLRKNGVAAQWERGFDISKIASSTARGNPLVAHVNTPTGGHFLVVDGVTTRMGQQVVAIRDPAGGLQYFETVTAFLKRFSGQVVTIK